MVERDEWEHKVGLIYLLWRGCTRLSFSCVRWSLPSFFQGWHSVRVFVLRVLPLLVTSTINDASKRFVSAADNSLAVNALPQLKLSSSPSNLVSTSEDMCNTFHFALRRFVRQKTC